jgi:hypothetical protein
MNEFESFIIVTQLLIGIGLTTLGLIGLAEILRKN